MITIDSIEYDVPVISMRRSADVLDKYAERTIDGTLHREIIGVYFNYYLEFASSSNTEEYIALWDKLTEPVEFHTIVLPDEDGEHTFEGYISSVKDEFAKVKDSERYMKRLTANFIAREIAR